MLATQFDRDEMAQWYAHEHLKTDPGLELVYYLPTKAGAREIRLVEINSPCGNQFADCGTDGCGSGAD